mmetsp:Transcript_1331/g.1389  ORF Transcript_1331/g.1389 Transcript_1331/m.1389 type:complete len:113 (-) Transcript_1331:24-362(-)
MPPRKANNAITINAAATMNTAATMIAVVVPSRHHDADVKDQAADAGTKGGKSPPPTLLSPRRMTSLPQPVPPSKDMPSNTTADTDRCRRHVAAPKLRCSLHYPHCRRSYHHY